MYCLRCVQTMAMLAVAVASTSMAQAQQRELLRPISLDLDLMVRPAPKQIPQPVPAMDLVNATASGGENLQGYGALSFRFNAGGAATMYDSDGASSGRWQRNGNQVTLHFYNGKVVYQGTIQGDQISGSASNGARNWEWNVRIQK